ncbi:MAG: long-chain-fatty-acid--CoA ligase [Deltaproteobacteria bacterium]|nr:long-chain-fatty-acid--CoA ligase [Deltaproteobacteria bacterium]
MVLREPLSKAARLFHRKEAIVCGEERFTYGEFIDRVYRFAGGLGRLGIGKGGKVAILHPNCHVFLESYFGTAITGAVLVPVNYRLSPREVAFILDDSESQLLIASPEFGEIGEQVQAGRPGGWRVLFSGAGGSYEEFLSDSGGEPPPPVSLEGDDLAQIYYTSGTTGRPKGVMLSHRNVASHDLGTIGELHLTDSDVWIHVAPMFHLADAWATWAVTWVGATHVMIPHFEARRVLETIERERVTITNMIPTTLNLLINDPSVGRYDCSSLRVLLSGGAPIAPHVVRRIIETFGCDYIQTYGMTETSPYLTLSILKDHLKRLPYEEQLKYKSKTGREFIGVELKVVREDDTEVNPDEKEVGEIIVRGEIVTCGYWKQPEETRKAIRDGWLYTGDMAVIDREGYVTIVDRKKDMIVTGGENVYSTEVEHVLYQHPAVLEAAVVGVPDEKWGEAVKAVVVLKEGQTATEGEIVAFCKENLAHYKSPKSVDLVDSLPKTGSGKIHKKLIRDAYWEGYEKKVH